MRDAGAIIVTCSNILGYFLPRDAAGDDGEPSFGREDAASRHVSGHAPEGRYRYFLRRHGRSEPKTTGTNAARE